MAARVNKGFNRELHGDVVNDAQDHFQIHIGAAAHFAHIEAVLPRLLSQGFVPVDLDGDDGRFLRKIGAGELEHHRLAARLADLSKNSIFTNIFEYLYFFNFSNYNIFI